MINRTFTIVIVKNSANKLMQPVKNQDIERLRGVAIIAVFLQHVNHRIPVAPGFGRLLDDHIILFATGVDLFLAVSGYSAGQFWHWRYKAAGIEGVFCETLLSVDPICLALARYFICALYLHN
jgi:peptidoglycan/LPS O-acetylase OafA/YrhL